MKYNELIIKIPTSREDEATAIISMLDIGGIYIEDYSDMMDCPLVKNFALIDEELLKKDTEYALLHIYFQIQTNMSDVREYLIASFDANAIPMSIVEQIIAEDDYANSWKQYYKPLLIKNMAIVPEWEEYEKKNDETILKIDPGMAFGTGTHETTSLCIEKIQDFDMNGKKCLDIGCGSGILSITGLLLGAGSVDATDIDPNAVKVTKENASLNSFDGTLNAAVGNILAMDDGARTLINGKKYDFIFANIVADVIIRLTDFIKDFMDDNGVFIMSGIITERRDDVMSALIKNGLKVTDEKEKGGWLCISASK